MGGTTGAAAGEAERLIAGKVVVAFVAVRDNAVGVTADCGCVVEIAAAVGIVAVDIVAVYIAAADLDIASG